MSCRPVALPVATAVAAVAALVAGVALGLSVQADAHPAPGPRPPSAGPDAPLVAAFDQVDQNTTWTLSRTIPQRWLPAGADWEQEGLKLVDGRFYVSVFDKTDQQARLEVLAADGTLIRDVALPDGVRTHAGGIDVYGGAAYVPVAEDRAHSSADVYRVDTRTFSVRRLFTVTADHVGGLTYDPVRQVLIGQDWDSRTFYEWTTDGRQLATWRNPNDYVGYQAASTCRPRSCSARPRRWGRSNCPPST